MRIRNAAEYAVDALATIYKNRHSQPQRHRSSSGTRTFVLRLLGVVALFSFLAIANSMIKTMLAGGYVYEQQLGVFMNRFLDDDLPPPPAGFLRGGDLQRIPKILHQT